MAMRAVGTPSSQGPGLRAVTASAGAGVVTAEADLAAAEQQQRRSLGRHQAAPAVSQPVTGACLPPRQRGRQLGLQAAARTDDGIGAAHHRGEGGAGFLQPPDQSCGPVSGHGTDPEQGETTAAQPARPRRLRPQWAASSKHQAETRG